MRIRRANLPTFDGVKVWFEPDDEPTETAVLWEIETVEIQVAIEVQATVVYVFRKGENHAQYRYFGLLEQFYFDGATSSDYRERAERALGLQ